MPTLVPAVPSLQASTCGIMRLIKRVKQRGKRKPPQIEVGLAFVGTAWCITADHRVVTAHHIFNNSQGRDPNDRFYAFIAPGNGPVAYHFPVTSFPFEDAGSDIAILELGPCSRPDQHIHALPVTFTRPPDGTLVGTYGFPAPEIKSANVNVNTGEFLGGGQFFLKGHANEGIVSAQYEIGGVWFYEFNVGWHHGESGGPVVTLEPLAVFAVMQHYRNIKGPHGILVGPHRGRSLETVRPTLKELGATII